MRSMDHKTLNRFPPVRKISPDNIFPKIMRQLISDEESKRKYTICDNEEDPSSKRRCLALTRDNEWAEEDYSSEQSDIDDEEEVLQNRQRLSTDVNHWSYSLSEAEVRAVYCLVKLARYMRRLNQQQPQPQPQTQTHTQTQQQPQPQPPIKTQPQPQPQIKTQPQIQLKCESYKCSVCGREFSTYQALGGHKASHRVKPPQPLVENATADARDKTRPKPLLPSGKIHKCSICHVVFPTGQALGGHKRCHYEGVIGGHKRGNDEVVLEGDKLSHSNSSSNGSVVKHELDLEQSLKASDGVLSGYKKSQAEVVVLNNDKLSPTSNGSVVTNWSESKQSLRSLIDLNSLPSPEFDKHGGGEVEEI